MSRRASFWTQGYEDNNLLYSAMRLSWRPRHRLQGITCRVNVPCFGMSVARHDPFVVRDDQLRGLHS